MKAMTLPLLAGALAVLASAATAGVKAETLPQAPAPDKGPRVEAAPWWTAQPVIAQTGYVRTEVEANRASFSANFNQVETTAAEASSKIANRIKPLTEVLKKLGRDKVRVTTAFHMTPIYAQYRDKDGNLISNQRGDKIEKYEVRANIGIEVRDTSLLEKAYALVMAARPNSTTSIGYSLEPSNELNAWLYIEAVKDAATRARQATQAAGSRLGAAKVIDASGRACQTDILARTGDKGYDGYLANTVDAPPALSYRAAPAPAPRMGDVQEIALAGSRAQLDPEAVLEAEALKTTFLQTPPLRELTARACVVYGLN